MATKIACKEQNENGMYEKRNLSDTIYQSAGHFVINFWFYSTRMFNLNYDEVSNLTLNIKTG